MNRVLKERSLGVVLLLLFLAAWGAQAYFGWLEFKGEQESHGTSPEIFGSSGYIATFLSATMENWQSEFLQLLAFVVLTSFLVWHGSPESRDSDDEMKAKLERIERQLDALLRHDASPVTKLSSAIAGGKVNGSAGGPGDAKP